MLAVNFLIAGISIWLIVAINNKYLQPALKNRYRFRIFRLRDELSVLAMGGELNENSEEYTTMIELINAAIRATGSFKVTDFLRFTFYLYKDEEVRKRIESIERKLNKTSNQEYCRIARDFFRTLHEMLHSDTRILRRVFLPLLLAFAALLSAFNFSSEPKTKIEDKKQAIFEMNEEIHRYSNKFGRMCPARI